MDRVLKFFHNKYVSAFCITYGACAVVYYIYQFSTKIFE